MIQTFVLAVFLVAAVLWWRYVASQKRQAVAPAMRQRARGSYRCVEVCAGTPACEAAQRLGNVRYLPDHAPLLPVVGCGEHACHCSYIHHDDRRENDRRNPYGSWSSLPQEVSGERRLKTERRSRESAFRPSMAR